MVGRKIVELVGKKAEELKEAGFDALKSSDECLKHLTTETVRECLDALKAEGRVAVSGDYEKIRWTGNEAREAAFKQQDEASETKSSMLDKIKKIVGDDVLEIFGDTGTAKSKFCWHIAAEALAAGKAVFYLDSERNLAEEDAQELAGNYRYTPVFSEIQEIVRKLGRYDLLIIDSVGLPILVKYARMSMKERGSALLDLIALMGDLKEWTYKNNSVAIVTNQPESDFNKPPGTVRYPFGDKSCFVTKEIWKTELIKRGEDRTICAVTSFRSRSTGAGKRLFEIEISDSGVRVAEEGSKWAE